MGIFYHSCSACSEKQGSLVEVFALVPILSFSAWLSKVLYAGFHQFAYRHKILSKELNTCYFHQIVIKVSPGKWLGF